MRFSFPRKPQLKKASGRKSDNIRRKEKKISGYTNHTADQFPCSACQIRGPNIIFFLRTEFDLLLLFLKTMSATVISDSIVITSGTDAQPVTAKLAAVAIDVEFAKCECCGLTEECTLAYIERIRERYQGKWICGLCSEAVKDEMFRCERLISTEEAMSRHFNFCNKIRSSGPPPDPTTHLISAFRQILRKSFDSPKSMRSMPCSPTKNGRFGVSLTRSGSCIPSLNLVESTEFRDVEVQRDSE